MHIQVLNILNDEGYDFTTLVTNTNVGYSINNLPKSAQKNGCHVKVGDMYFNTHGNVDTLISRIQKYLKILDIDTNLLEIK